jgi:asparagine synthase (glutamine-hydrolysing)
MCGLNAIFAHGAGAPNVESGELIAVRDTMTARGPDAEGSWISADSRVGLGHRRLSIIDLSQAANQPMALAGGRLRIAYNGEIYNFRALRRRLQAEGRVFETESDTEVLLHLYDRYGPDMVRHLRGMFAFALWDEVRRGMLLGRDPFGIKPLYYTDDGKTLRVASQVKALLAGGGVGGAPDPAGHVGFFLFGYVPEPHTLYADIRAVAAGSTLWIDAAGDRRIERYFEPARQLAATAGAPPPLDLGKALRESVEHHLVADVPVGAFLSAGLDSAAITGLASESRNGDLDTMTLGFEEYRGTSRDEVPLAEAVAATYGTRHHTRWVTGADFHGDLGALLAAMDQPSIDGVNTYFVAKEAAAMGLKVALSGLGGDEFFGGYDTFRQVPALVGHLGWVPGGAALGRGLRVVAAPLLGHLARHISPKAAGLLEYGTTYGDAYLLRRGLFMPWELGSVLDADLLRAGWRELAPRLALATCAAGIAQPRAKVAALEMTWYMGNQLLRDADWAGMAHSLEIRVPLVDAEFFAQVAPHVGGAGAPTKQAMAEVLAEPLPGAVLGRPKSGFFVPVREWLEGGEAGASERGLRGWGRRVYEAAWGAAA